MTTSSEESPKTTSRPARLGFVVLSHGRQGLLRRLVDVLTASPATVGVVVHHDRASPPIEISFSRPELVCSHPDPSEVRWGKWSLVEATTKGLHLLSRCFPGVDWMIVLSGQDYPSRPLGDLASLLGSDRADAFLDCQPATDNWSTDEVRVRYGYDYWDVPPWMARTHLQRAARLMPAVTWSRNLEGRHVVGVRRRRDLRGLFGGSAWFMASRRAVDILLRSASDTHLTRQFERSLIPDEVFYATVLMHSELVVHRSNYRFARFQDLAPHPDVLTIDSLDAIDASNAFFVRKVEEDHSSALLDALDRRNGRCGGSRQRDRTEPEAQ